MFIPGCICNANTDVTCLKLLHGPITNDRFVNVKSDDSALVLLMVAQS